MLETVLVGVFGVVLLGVTLPLLRQRVLLKMGIRNLARRKGYTTIVVLGLMVGTAVITASLAVGDTMDHMISSEILREYHTTDQQIVAELPSGEQTYFNQSLFDRFEQGLAAAPIDGLAPGIDDYVAVFNAGSNLSEARVRLLGVDFQQAAPFGDFTNQERETVFSLDGGQALLGAYTARDLEAGVGDTLMVFANNNLSLLTVAHVLRAEGRAQQGRGLFVSLATAQEVVGEAGHINEILVSNQGGVREGMTHTEEVRQAFAAVHVDSPLVFKMVEVKKDLVEENREGLSAFTDMFFVFGTFSIIAGVILIINIFVMLAEERKSEMGMARAIGMRRAHLKRMYVAEGLLYALGAAGVGVLFGVTIGYMIMFAMGEIFRAFGAFDILQYFTVTPDSMITGFVAGFLITVVTIYLTAHRISRLNIVRAIRNISEPPLRPRDRRITATGAALLAGGLLAVLAARENYLAAFLFSGVSLCLFGVGVLARRWAGDRPAFSVAALLVIIWWFVPASWLPEYGGSLEMFILSGLFMVFSAILLVMFNARQLTRGVTAVLGRGKTMPAVLRTSVAYSLRSRFRTGMTMAIFALVIFSITVMSMMVGILGTNIEMQVDQAAGGYDIMAFTLPSAPIPNLREQLAAADMEANFTAVASLLSTRTTLIPPDSEEELRYPLLGVDDEFLATNAFTFQKLLPAYDSGEAAWQAVRENHSLVVVDGSVLGVEFGPPAVFTADLGDTLTFRGKDNRTVNKTVIGVLDTTVMQGVYTYGRHLAEEYEVSGPTFFLLGTASGVDGDRAARELEREFLPYGMQTTVMKTVVQEIIRVMNQFFNLFEAFMALGLVIGIAGLGIITIRSVHERRQEIGMLRAIGFRQRDVLSSFLIETSFVAVLGIVIGTLLGIFIGYTLWHDEFRPEGFTFAINWQPILLVAAVALVVTLLSVVPASRKASRVPPAEALRYQD